MRVFSIRLDRWFRFVAKVIMRFIFSSPHQIPAKTPFRFQLFSSGEYEIAGRV